LKSLQLPIQAVLTDIQQTLQQHDELVLQAPTGAGKTTMVPLALLNESWLGSQKILMLEPRRMAARTAAERMAGLLNEKVGETVGYRIRQENKISRKTRIEVITEGVLTRLLQNDPELKGVGLVIFDEFHERSLNTDLGLALSLQARELFREQDNPLKLLIMSATLDGSSIAEMLGNAPQLCSEGKMFPVTVHYSSAPKAHAEITDAVVKAIHQAIQQTDGSILVFLPGQGEINRVQKVLQAEVDKDICILPLYGALPISAQMKAIRPLDKDAGCNRKIVLATDIAETSITIDGISTIVDSGLCRQPRFDPSTAMTRLHTRRISQASSIQRMGRAGRTRVGHCYRLWSESSQKTLEKHTPAEILQADLCPLVLQLLQWGISDSNDLSWLDNPPIAAFNQALDVLKSLGAIKQNPDNHSINLNRHGQQMAQFPVHPRLAHMLIKASNSNQDKTAAALATLLSDKDPLRHYASDITSKVAVLLGEIPCENQHKGWFQRSKQQMKTFQRLCASIEAADGESIDDEDVIGWLISLAYPDRIAQQRSENSRQYLLSNGRAAALNPEDKLARHHYLAIAALGGMADRREDTIYAAAPLNPQLFERQLATLVTQQQYVDWEDQTGRLLAEQRDKIGSLIIRRKPLKNIPVETKRQALMQRVRQKGLRLLPWDDNTRRWQARILCLRNHQIDAGSHSWPDVSDKNLLDTLEEWLLPFVDHINRQQDFSTLDLAGCLSTLLPWPLPAKLEELAPLTIEVPSGSNIKIDYSKDPPVLAVKLQEMFGCQQTPTIANGRIKLLVHLLSPARKPLQITQDLAGFWQGSYHQVKKEMKGRYPKHPWPNDPLQALATRYTKHKRR